MTRALLSADWYRVGPLRPRLRGHVQLHRHVYRGQVWHVVEDRMGGRHHRFNPAAWRVIALLDGRRSLDELWAGVANTLDDDTPTQDEIIRLVGQLHAADLLQADLTPDLADLFERRGRQLRRRWMARVGNPLALRVPLIDPDRLLKGLLRLAGPLAGRAGVVLWLAVVLPALLLLPLHWAELSANAGERLLSQGNLWLLALLFPLVKLVHELGHGLACRVRGGEVHELGVMLLVFYPVPYVDVSSAAAFGGKWQRALVGAAGMGAELFVAALAFYLWLVLEPGLARALAYDVAVLASVTTLFFNANPLLRYDGYYILADLVEVPNLGQRATRWWQYMADRWVFGVRAPERPPATPGEQRWFVGYAPLSYAYRLFVAFGIALMVAQQYFFVGLALALWSLVSSVLWPLLKGLHALATAPRYAAHAARVRGVLVGTVALAGLALFAWPVPYHTAAEGVLWLPERAILRAEGAGFAHRLLAEPGQALQAGQPVLQSVEPALAARIAVQQAKVEEVLVQIDAAWGPSQARVQQLQQELAREQAALARLADEAAALTLRSPLAGTLLLDKPGDLPGRYLKKGDVVGYVRTAGPPLVRLVLPQADVDTVRLGTRQVQALLPQQPVQPVPARLLRSVPGAARSLPSAVLGSQGGGEVVTDPGDQKGLATVESLFELEVELTGATPPAWLGSRVHLRFEHAAEPLGQRLWRGARRAFLAHLRW